MPHPLTRRAAAAVAAAVLALGLSACGGDDEPATPTDAALTAPAPEGEEALPESTPEGAPPGVDDATLAAGEPVEVPLAAQNGSGQTGTARLIPVGEGLTRVVVELGNPPAEPQPAHLHRGTCATLDPTPAYALTDAVDGSSETFVPVSLTTLRESPFAVNVHRSAADAATYVACGELPSLSGPAGG